MNNKEKKEQMTRRRALTKIAGVGGVSMITLANDQWLKPSLKAVVLPAHAQTSEACMDGELLTLEVTSNDFSQVELELFSVGGGSTSLLQISAGDLSGNGTQVLYQECQPESGCYEVVFRGGEGTARMSLGATSNDQTFPPVPSIITLGVGCN